PAPHARRPVLMPPSLADLCGMAYTRCRAMLSRCRSAGSSVIRHALPLGSRLNRGSFAMYVTFHCPACQQVRGASVAAGTAELACDGCHWSRPLRSDDLGNGAPERCLVCGCDDLWRQKDFPQRVGLAMVALGALLSTIAWAYHLPATALGILLGFALVDLLLFTFMKDVLVCYRCHARYRDVPFLDDHPRFNLETAERYRQEGARLKEAQGADARRAAGSPP